MSDRCPSCGAEGDERHGRDCEYIGNDGSRSYQAALRFVIQCIDAGLKEDPRFGNVRRDLVLSRVSMIRERLSKRVRT